MSEISTLEILKEKSIKIDRWLNYFIAGAILIVGILLFTVVSAIFSPATAFTVEQGVEHWRANFSPVYFDTAGFFITIPFTQLQPLGEHMFEAKHAYITFQTFLGISYFAPLFYGIFQVKKILYAVTTEYTPFTEENKKRMKKIAWAIIIYALAGDLLINLAMNMFVTQIYSFNPIHISLTGLIIGGLMLILVHIFDIGIELQQDADTTL